MAYGFEKFGLPEDFHQKIPHKFYFSRENRRRYLLWLANHLGIALPSENQDAWYSLRYEQVTQPIEGVRPIGNNLLNWDRINPQLTRHYAFVIIDAFPDVTWDITRFEGKLNQKSKADHTFVTGYNLPHPDDDVISKRSRIIHVSGQDICRPYLTEIAHRLNIPDDDWRAGWSQQTMAKIAELNPPMRKWESFRNAFANSLFRMLSINFDKIGFLPWEVGGNGPVGFGNRSRFGDEKARADVRYMLQHYVSSRFKLELTEESLDILYYVDQRGLNELNGVCKNHFNGSPQQMIEFAYPEYEWDPTRFGTKKVRQRRAYFLIQNWLTNEERAAMNQQTNRGWEHSLSNEFNTVYPAVTLPNGHAFGGDSRSRITADIFIRARLLMIDILGEDHTDPSLRRSNDRSTQDVNNRFHQRWIQDRQRWQLCLSNGVSVVAIGPNFQFTDREIQELNQLVESVEVGSPMLEFIGFPADYVLPTISPCGTIEIQPLPRHYHLIFEQAESQ